MLNHLNWVESHWITSQGLGGGQRSVNYVRVKGIAGQVCVLVVMLGFVRVSSMSPGE